jgi:3-oxoacyl-[acyl-carrier protein] reductase
MSVRAARWFATLRNVIVTGGSRGLGLAIATRLVDDGYRVIAVARRESDGLREAMARSRGALVFAAFDFSNIDAIADFVLALKKQHGAPYGLVNNAALGTEGLLATMHNSQIEELLRVNVTAPIVLSKYVVRNMMASGAGRVVNISSIIASTGYNGLAAYGASKAALVGFTKSLAREVGLLGITVNAIAPGFMKTELTASMDDADRAKIAARAALRRLAEPADVAAAVAYLMGDAARNVTGTVLTIDAGATA